MDGVADSLALASSDPAVVAARRRAWGSAVRTASAKTAAKTASYVGRSRECRTRVVRAIQYSRLRSRGGSKWRDRLKVSVALRSTAIPASRSRRDKATAKAARSTARSRKASAGEEMDDHHHDDFT